MIRGTAMMLRMATIPEAWTAALAHYDAGRLAEAEQVCRQILAADSKHVNAWHLLGGLALRSGQRDLAIQYLRRTVELEPRFSQAYHNLGTALQEQGQLAEAVECYRRALVLRPDLAQAESNLGTALGAMGQLEEAIAAFRRALAHLPGLAQVQNNLGNALQKQGQIEEAIACYQKAIELQPDFPEARNNLSTAFKAQGKLDEAVASYQQALSLKSQYPEALNNLANALKDMARMEEAVDCFRRALAIRPNFAAAHSNLAYSLTFCEGYDAAAIYDEARRFDEQHTAPLAQFIQTHANERSPNRRLRIGYVSPDFRNHCQAFFTLPLLSAHDHERFEIFCYADVVLRDPITERLRGLSDVWRDIQGWTAEKTAEVIRQDQIDILVDLTMHMEGAHPFVFARKPAPVQICWLAYPGTTGLTAIDFRLTDPHLDPPGMFDEFYAEESIRLADTFWCYDPLASEPAVSPLPALTNGHVTFGCLNNFCKVNATTLRLWAGILKAVSGSRLILLAPEGSARQWVLRVLDEEGVNAERIAFVPRQGRLQYLETYRRIDIGLDTLPYNGHTTSLDAFWMGVPVVTLVGQTVVGRAGLSQLTNLGLPELIAKEREKYVEIVADLAADLPRLSQLRAGLRQRMRQSPLMDGPRFARNVEAAYRDMWRRWCASGASSP
jgi:protein O-GlcNAc transferase